MIAEIPLGQALVKQVFQLARRAPWPGASCAEGRSRPAPRARVRRQGEVIFEGALASLKRFQNDASEVRDGQCGIRLDNFGDYQTGDLIEAYDVQKIAQEEGLEAGRCRASGITCINELLEVELATVLYRDGRRVVRLRRRHGDARGETSPDLCQARVLVSAGDDTAAARVFRHLNHHRARLQDLCPAPAPPERRAQFAAG